MTEPLLTVIIPTYNRVDSVVRAVRSVGIHPSVEIVIVDDASNDSVFSELEQRLRGIPGVRLYRNESNLGMVRNWNECIHRANGKWISLMCSDDHYVDGAVDRMLETISSLGECLVIQTPGIDGECEYLKGGCSCASSIRLPIASGNVWRSSISRALGGFDGELKYSPDGEYWFRMARNYDVLMVREPFAEYVSHDSNYMWDTWKEADFIDQVKLLSRKVARYVLSDCGTANVEAYVASAVEATIGTMLSVSASHRRLDLLLRACRLARNYSIPAPQIAIAIKSYLSAILRPRGPATGRARSIVAGGSDDRQ